MRDGAWFCCMLVPRRFAIGRSGEKSGKRDGRTGAEKRKRWLRATRHSPFALNGGLRVNFRACGSKIQGSRFNGRPPVSKTGCGGSIPSSPASSAGGSGLA